MIYYNQSKRERKIEMKKVLKCAETVVCGVSAVAVAWVALSVLEVMCNNLNPDYQYCALNIFSILMGA